MTLVLANTTISALLAAFRTALEGVTPTHTRGQSNGWKYWQQNHAPSMGTRWFRFEWDDNGLVENGIMWRDGSEHKLTCSIVTDYGGVPEQEIDPLANPDYHQIWDVLDRLRTTTNGLRRVKGVPGGWALTTESAPNQVQVIHQYEVFYLQGRA